MFELFLVIVVNLNHKAFKYKKLNLFKMDKFYLILWSLLHVFAILSVYHSLGFTDKTMAYLYENTPYEFLKLLSIIGVLFKASHIFEILCTAFIFLKILKLVEYTNFKILYIWIDYVDYIFEYITQKIQILLKLFKTIK